VPLKTAALYVRVSTHDQTTANQEPECMALAAARGWEVDPCHVYRETVSGVSLDRPVFDAMRAHARRRQFGAVVVWSIDRLGRNLDRIVSTVRELDAAGVIVASVQEPWLDMGGPARDLLLYVFAWVAEYERGRLRERTCAGIARARADGVRLGRPPSPIETLRAAVAAVEGGMSARKAAAEFGLGASTIRRAKKGSAGKGR
jgi:putative DNA-invertase from lambdoid prophage Rac